MSQNLFRNLDIAALADRVNTFTLNVQDFQMMTPTLAKVVLTYSGKSPIPEEIRAATAKLFSGLASPVVASFRSVFRDGDIKSVVGFVKSNREVRELTEEVEAGMKVMASNLLMDKSDKSVWEVKSGSGNAKYIIRQGEEDLSELVQLANSRKVGAPVLAQIANTDVAEREFAAYVDIETEEVLHGYVVARAEDDELEVLPVGSDELVKVSASQLVQVIHFEGEDEEAFGRQMATAGVDKSAMIEYYKKAYSYAPDYVQKIIEMINSHSFQ